MKVSGDSVMKFYFLMPLLFLAVCSSASGVYSSDSVTVMAGGFGYAPIDGNNTYAPGNKTLVDAGRPILTAGTLTEVKIRLSDGGSDCSLARLKILYGTYPNYSVRSTFNITNPLNTARVAGGRFLLDLTGLSIPVQAGDMIGIFIADPCDSVNIVTKSATGTNIYSGSGDTSSMDTAYAGESLLMEAYVTTNQFVIYDNINNGNGFTPSNNPVCVPYFTNQNQYIILRGVDNVDINENLTIALQWTDANGNSNAIENVIIDMVQQPSD
jgi:hypothetical protein